MSVVSSVPISPNFIDRFFMKLRMQNVHGKTVKEIPREEASTRRRSLNSSRRSCKNMFPHDVMRDSLDSMQAIKGNLQPDEFLWFLFFCV